VIRVELPYHLRNLIKAQGEVELEVPGPVTIRSVLDTLEARHPVLCGLIRDHGTLERRPFLRYYACKEDLSHDPIDTPLPKAVVEGEEPLIVLGSISGG
jgi:sulfur-carrier protein